MVACVSMRVQWGASSRLGKYNVQAELPQCCIAQPSSCSSIVSDDDHNFFDDDDYDDVMIVWPCVCRGG